MLDDKILEQYDGFIFDMDGTLIDTMPAHAKAWGLVGERLGYPLDSQIMFQFAGAPVRKIAEEMMKAANMPLSQLDLVIQTKREISYDLVPRESTLLPAFEIAKRYYQKKPMAIGSGSHRRMINLIMNEVKIAHYFDGIVSADDVEHHKPHPETFLRCAEICQISPAKALVFEDADLGVEAALKGGMDVFDVRINQLIKA